ncbi:hypothetical protein [Aestuariivirga sp.]|uniref:hypothetical protein n=1 Tax=Aestuariivirga sp. TaxID=2650926 RepID=UPI0039E4219A
MRRDILISFCLSLWIAASLSCGVAHAGGVVAIVADVPVTEFDITARITLAKILDPQLPPLDRKKALQGMVDDVIKRTDAKKYNMDASNDDVNDEIKRIAGRMKLSSDGLLKQLAGRGINETFFRNYLSAQLGFNRILASKYRSDIKVNDSDIDSKTAEIKSKVDAQMAQLRKDPRMNGITVFNIMEITLPVESSDDPALLQARAVEAQQVQQQFKSCSNPRAAASGVFNVKFGKMIEADAAKLPPPLRAALQKAGVNKAIGPMRGPGGIQLIAFCGSRKITPEMPTFKMPDRDQISNIIVNEKYDGYEASYMATARKKVYVEYRDPSYAP